MEETAAFDYRTEKDTEKQAVNDFEVFHQGKPLMTVNDEGVHFTLGDPYWNDVGGRLKLYVDYLQRIIKLSELSQE
jgi:hypothetical protein